MLTLFLKIRAGHFGRYLFCDENHSGWYSFGVEPLTS